MEDYFMRYGMEENPFLKNSREILLETLQFREAQTRLDRILTTRGFGVLTGGPGKGKTTNLRVWSRKLNPSLYKVVYNKLSTLSVNDFYRNLVLNLGLEPCYRKPDNFRMIQEEIIRYAEKRITPIIVIDEAMHICKGILHDLKCLFNFDMDSRDLAIVIMTGLPELNRTLNLKAHESLRQRITMNYNMEGMTKEESRRYIQKKLEGVGCVREVFDPNALESLINAGNGIPRMINNIADRAMQISDSKNLDQINADIIAETVSDLELK